MGHIRYTTQTPNPSLFCCFCAKQFWEVDFPDNINAEEKATLMAFAFEN
jgi:hypothetical protein